MAGIENEASAETDPQSRQSETRWLLGPLDPVQRAAFSDALERKRDSALARIRRRKNAVRILRLISALLLLVLIRFLSHWASWWYLPVLLITACLPFIFSDDWSAEQQARDLEEEAELQRYADERSDLRSARQFQRHQRELKRYYDQSLAQSSRIFFVGLFCIALGFAVIVATLVLVASNTIVHSVPEKIILAALGAVGSLLANFVAAIYIRMFTEIIRSYVGFHNRLVTTHHIHTAAFLASAIDDPVRREEALATIAVDVSKPPVITGPRNAVGQAPHDEI